MITYSPYALLYSIRRHSQTTVVIVFTVVCTYLSLHAGMDFNDTQPFEVTMAAGTTVVSAEIPIFNDEINEAEEKFIVVLEVVSNTTNPVVFTTQTTVCRIPRSDRKYQLELIVNSTWL